MTVRVTVRFGLKKCRGGTHNVDGTRWCKNGEATTLYSRACHASSACIGQPLVRLRQGDPYMDRIDDCEEEECLREAVVSFVNSFSDS